MASDSKDISCTERDGHKQCHVKCKGCKQGFGWPRNIEYINVASSAQTVAPTTKDTIVPYLSPYPGTGEPSLCPDLFTRLHFIRHGMRLGFNCRTLVTEFQYQKKTGFIYNDINQERKDEETGYARLVTLNSWWVNLLMNMFHMSLGVFDIAITMSLIISLWQTPGDECSSSSEPDTGGGFIGNFQLREFFTATYISLNCVALFLAFVEAKKEWKLFSNPRIGDITLLPDRYHRLYAFMALVIFTFFGVDAFVRNIVIILHPWKGGRPYAAIKMYGTRAHVAGWENPRKFTVENKAGQQCILPFKMLVKCVILFFKVALSSQHNWASYTLWPVLTTMGSLSLTSYGFFHLLYDRIKFSRLNRKARKKAAAAAAAAPAATPPKPPPPKQPPPQALGLIPLEQLPSDQEVQPRLSRDDSFQRKEEALEQKRWRESAFEERHFGIWPSGIFPDGMWPGDGSADGVNSAGANNVASAPEEEPCSRCGRDILAAEDRELLLQAAPLNVGDAVKLVKHALKDKKFHDADRGPLRCGEVGTVIEVSDAIENYGARVRVQAITTLATPRGATSHRPGMDAGKGWKNTSWWYDAAALETSEPVTSQPRDVVCSDLGSAMRQMMAGVSDLRNLLDAAPPADALNAKMRLKQVFDPLYKVGDALDAPTSNGSAKTLNGRDLGPPAKEHGASNGIRRSPESGGMPLSDEPVSSSPPEPILEALRHENHVLRADLDALRQSFELVSGELRVTQDRLKGLGQATKPDASSRSTDALPEEAALLLATPTPRAPTTPSAAIPHADVLGKLQDRQFMKGAIVLKIQEHERMLVELQAKWLQMEREDKGGQLPATNEGSSGAAGTGEADVDLVQWWQLRHEEAEEQQRSRMSTPKSRASTPRAREFAPKSR